MTTPGSPPVSPTATAATVSHQLQPASQRRVVTTPPWASKLPVADYDDHGQVYTRAESTARHRSASSSIQPPVSSETIRNASVSPTPSSAGVARLGTEDNPANALISGKEVTSKGSGSAPNNWWIFASLGNRGSQKLKEGVEEGQEFGRDDRGKGKALDLEKSEITRPSSAVISNTPEQSYSNFETPGWSTPWAPFKRPSSHVPDPFLAMSNGDPIKPSRKSRFESFLLNSPFAPLVFRFFNLVFTLATMIVAILIRVQERRNNVVGITGSGIILTIAIAPFAILHIFINLYVEYFGRPIGIWRLRTKMSHVLLEILFVCLWSSTLSLSFDDLLESPLQCTPYEPYRASTLYGGYDLSLDPLIARALCRKEAILISFVFLSLLLYIAILIVNLFRIFERVSRPNH